MATATCRRIHDCLPCCVLPASEQARPGAADQFGQSTTPSLRTLHAAVSPPSCASVRCAIGRSSDDQDGTVCAIRRPPARSRHAGDGAPKCPPDVLASLCNDPRSCEPCSPLGAPSRDPRWPTPLPAPRLSCPPCAPLAPRGPSVSAQASVAPDRFAPATEVTRTPTSRRPKATQVGPDVCEARCDGCQTSWRRALPLQVCGRPTGAAASCLAEVHTRPTIHRFPGPRRSATRAPFASELAKASRSASSRRHARPCTSPPPEGEGPVHGIGMPRGCRRVRWMSLTSTHWVTHRAGACLHPATAAPVARCLLLRPAGRCCTHGPGVCTLRCGLPWRGRGPPSELWWRRCAPRFPPLTRAGGESFMHAHVCPASGAPTHHPREGGRRPRSHR